MTARGRSEKRLLRGFVRSDDERGRRSRAYRQQARVKNGFFRYKSVLGAGLKARNSKAQRREATIGCHILNRMAELGKPESYVVVSRTRVGKAAQLAHELNRATAPSDASNELSALQRTGRWTPEHFMKLC